MRSLYYISIACWLLSGPVLKAEPLTDFLSEETTHSIAMRQLKAVALPLPEADLQACLGFLAKRFDHNEEILLVVRQNDLADRLLQHEASVTPATGVLLRVIVDASADILWRDYSLQKLPTAYEQDALAGPIRAKIIKVLRQGASDPSISFSGTSLLGLYRLREAAQIPESDLIALAKAIVEGDKFATSNKVTALQIAVLLGDPESLEQARAIAMDPDAATQLRVSAIASIGQRGTALDVPLIEPFLSSADFRLRNAAKAAVQKLTS